MQKERNLSAWRDRGYRTEFDLVVNLRMNGFKAIRFGAGGSSPNLYYTPLPDVIASKDGSFYAFEVKRRTKGYSYIKKDQIEKLHLFLDMIPIEQEKKHALVAVKDKREWRFFHIDEKLWQGIQQKGQFNIRPISQGNWNPREV